MRKWTIGWICLLLLLVSCSPREQDEDIIQDSDDEEELAIVPGYQLGTENYKVILPYQPSAARGVIVNQVANRLDIDEMEEGLRRHSTEVFDPKDHFFEEGQYLEKDTVYNWLGRKLTKDQLNAATKEELETAKTHQRTVNEDEIRTRLQLGLNPKLDDIDDKKKDDRIKAHEESPRYISHVLEHNFLKKNKDDNAELAGVSIAIAVKSVYRFQIETGGASYYKEIPEKEMIKQGKEAAQTILERMREDEDLTDVPIMFALYKEEEQEHPVPGNYFAKTLVPAQDMLIGDWESVDEQTVLYPSKEASKDYPDEEELFEKFADDIATFFPNYVGVIGEGFYVEGDLKKMDLTIPMEFQGSGEITGFTQYIYGRVNDVFERNDYALEIKVEANNKIESIITREPGEDDPTVHMLH